MTAISRTESDLQELHKLFKCTTIQADLSDKVACIKAAKQVGPVDYLVNNAGIGIVDPFLKLKIEDFDNMIRTNLYSTVLMS